MKDMAATTMCSFFFSRCDTFCTLDTNSRLGAHRTMDYTVSVEVSASPLACSFACVVVST